MARGDCRDAAASIQIDAAALLEDGTELLTAPLDATLHARQRHADALGGLLLRRTFQINDPNRQAHC